jgi:Ca-activated chloride channel family protein
MQPVLPILTDEEVRRIVPSNDQSGFGALETAKGLLPLKALDVQTRISGLLAEVSVSQTFVNTLTEPIEATYIFPLPDRAAVTRFRMEVAGRVVEGVLKERSKAREEYEKAIQEGRRAAITEEDRSGVFTLRVGNLMPGEEALIRLTLSELLPFDDGEATFRFPLVVAPRYIPGMPLPGPSVGDGYAPDTDAVPDASRITPPVLLPGFPNPVRLSLSVEVDPVGLAVSHFRSSLHAVATEDGQGRRRFTLNPGERLNRDFILRFRLGANAVRTSLALHPDANGDGREGTLVLTLVPPAGEAQTLQPRDLVFVLDRSGSMGGWKIAAARRALARMIDTLNERDRFTVYAFDNVIETPPSFEGSAPVPATDRNRFRATEFLARLEARGGTEMAQPLLQAVQQLSSQLAPGVDPHSRSECATVARDCILVLITDGQIGNEDQILGALVSSVRDLRIFTLGIDQAVNAGFLRRLAALGGGLCELIESEDRLDAVLDKIHRRIGTPVLTGLRLEPAGLEVDSHSLVPRRLPDLFAGAPLVLLGRYRGAPTGSVTLQAQDAAGSAWSETAPARRSENPAIAAVWARGQVRELEDRYLAGHEQARLEKQIVDTSVKFGVLSRFTAFIAVDVKEVVNPDGKVHRIMQPVEPAAGWAMLGTEAREYARTLGSIACHGFTRSAMSVKARESAPSARAFDAAEGESIDSLLQEFEDVSGSVSAPAYGTPAQTPPGLVPPAATPERGMVSRLFDSMFGRSGALPADLAGYRRRAQALLEKLTVPAPIDAAERLTRLRMLAVQLAALVEDAKSTGVPATEIRALHKLLKDLQALSAARRQDDAEVDRLWSQAVSVLQAFGASAPTGRREQFWK